MDEIQTDIVFMARMSLAAFLAFIVGWERESRGSAAETGPTQWWP